MHTLIAPVIYIVVNKVKIVMKNGYCRIRRLTKLPVCCFRSDVVIVDDYILGHIGQFPLMCIVYPH